MERVPYFLYFNNALFCHNTNMVYFVILRHPATVLFGHNLMFKDETMHSPVLEYCLETLALETTLN